MCIHKFAGDELSTAVYMTLGDNRFKKQLGEEHL